VFAACRGADALTRGVGHCWQACQAVVENWWSVKLWIRALFLARSDVQHRNTHLIAVQAQLAVLD
jgi:hypothetical protein